MTMTMTKKKKNEIIAYCNRLDCKLDWYGEQSAENLKAILENGLQEFEQELMEQSRYNGLLASPVCAWR